MPSDDVTVFLVRDTLIEAIRIAAQLLLFVLVDGWQLIVGSLLDSFVTGEAVQAGSSAAGAGLLMLCFVRRPTTGRRKGGSGHVL